jgi:hypothetical protein
MNASIDWMRRRQQDDRRMFLTDGEVLHVPAGSRNAQRVPVWHERVINRVSELMQLRDNWDSYGGKAPGVLAAAAMVNVLNSIMRSDTPAPSIVPSPRGHLQAEWHIGGIDLEIEVLTPTEVIASYSHPHFPTQSWDDRPFALDFTDLVAAIQNLEP